MARAGRLAAIKVTGDPVAFTDEATTTGDDTVYQISNAAKRVWDREAAIVVEDGGIPTVEDYTVNRLTGEITFESADNTRVITVTGEYLPLSTAAEAKSYSYSLSCTELQDNKFGDNWESFTQGLKKFSGSLGQWYGDSYFSDALIAGTIVVLELYSLSTDDPDIRAWVIINKDDVTSAIEALVESSVEFSGRHDDDGRVVALL